MLVSPVTGGLLGQGIVTGGLIQGTPAAFTPIPTDPYSTVGVTLAGVLDLDPYSTIQISVAAVLDLDPHSTITTAI